MSRASKFLHVPSSVRYLQTQQSASSPPSIDCLVKYTRYTSPPYCSPKNEACVALEKWAAMEIGVRLNKPKQQQAAPPTAKEIEIF